MMTREEILERLRVHVAALDDVINGYSKPGVPESYGAYQEGRSDLADEVCTFLEQLLRDAADAPPQEEPKP